ncbi:MAG TPA: hypothetical protein PKC18_19350, partial [Lacipirellulaceae bacterium]|nr:hypothetical protein [Lacipirellulaceae bacterium]
AFQQACLNEMAVEIRSVEAVAGALAGLASTHGAKAVVTGVTPDPHVKRIVRALRKPTGVVEVSPPPSVHFDVEVDLRRFSRYWGKAERRVDAD